MNRNTNLANHSNVITENSIAGEDIQTPDPKAINQAVTATFSKMDQEVHPSKLLFNIVHTNGKTSVVITLY